MWYGKERKCGYGEWISSDSPETLVLSTTSVVAINQVIFDGFGVKFEPLEQFDPHFVQIYAFGRCMSNDP